MNFSIKPSSTTISLFFFLSIFLFHQSSIAQQPAFPSAYGAGAYTEGGRGGKIVHVTNLNDSGSGSLRWALTDRSNKGVKRTIVFDVSGVINLQEWIYMSNSPGDEGGYADGITIAGQTAPEGGITITGDRLRLSSINNVVVRYLKFRESPSGLGGLTILQSNDVVIDHLSASHGNSISIVMAASKTSNIDNNTLQNCLMGQSKNGVLAGNSEFANGAVSLPYGGISILRNAYYNVGWRIPGKFGGQAEVDVVNNIAHNWQGRLMRFDPYNYSLNHIGNYYQSGLTTLNSGSSVLHKTWTNSTMAPKIYNYDNFVSPDVKPVGYDTDESTAWAPFTAASVEPVKAEWFVNFQLPMQGRPVPVLLSSQLKQEILPHVGASKYLNGDGTVGFYRDSLDLAFVHGINIRDMTLRSQNGQVPTGMPSETRPSNFYNLSKNEHIPEVWFDANVPAGQDHNDIAPSGYTWLEEYLNQVDGPSVIVAAQSVEVTPGKTELQISKILQLAKTFTPANAANQNGTWTSSDEDIAKVDANGLVTAIAVGEVTITFTATEGGHKGKSEITVFPEALQASAGTDQNICQGSSTTLTATGGSTYLWSTGEKTEEITVSPTATTTYTVTAYDSTGKNSDTDDVKVTVNPLPTVDAGNSVTINSGESTTLTATGATSYEWSTGATSASITVTPTATKTYTVTGTTNGCEATDTVKVTVSNSETVVADAGGERNLCAGSSTTLTATGGATYLWSTGEKTAKITVSPTVTTIFKVTAYDSTGKNSDKADVKINVNPLPTVDAGNSVTINSGESTTLTAIGAASFKWSTGATTASITVSPTATKTYTVTGTTNGCEATDKVTVTVKTAAKVVANAGSDQNICSGSSTTLTATGGDTYLWNTGAKTESITVNPSSKTSYSVTAFVGKASDTDEVVVYVDAQPNVKIINGSDTTILEGEFITLSASGANTYKWSNGATQPNIAVSPRVTKSYEVTGFVNNCAAQRSIKVNVFEKVVADAGNDVTICSSEKTVLTASGPNNTEYLWNTGETTKSITVDPKVDTEYSVMVYHALDSDTDNVMVKVENCTTPEQITEDSIELTEDATELEFLIHPNPTYGDVNIKVSGLTNLSSIHLYDLSGKSLYNEVINEGDQQSYVKTLNLSDYASGIYLLQLVDNYRVITKKIVLR
ncbi:hypothetical protein A9996_17590 [Gelidibacter algens]|nr:Ig-like domain-containing protein [Gelidibacter algens]OBX21898.1 hypothetical protein A9996_17590 [Gelidibacter algens]